MGATTSVQRDAKSSEDAATDERCTEVNESRDGELVDEKQMQKNGQISVSSLNGKTDEHTDFNGLSEDKTLSEGQTDATPQKEDSPETIEVLQDEVSPQVNGEQEESECVKADKTTAIEETVVEEKPNEANEVGFKKIFRFVGFKFTLKKDKNEKTEPVQLLTVKETEDGASEAVAVESKEETVEVKSEEENISVAPQTEEEVTIKDTADAEAATDLPQTDAPAETTTDGAAAPEQTHTEQPAEDMTTAPEKESEVQAESPTSPGSQEMQSSFKRFFTQGIFSNLRKKTSFKKPKEEEPMKEKSVEEDIKETDEKPGEVAAEKEQVKDDIEEVAADKQVDKVEAPDEVKDEGSPEEAPSNTEEPKEEEPKVQATAANETEAPPEAEPVAQTTTCEDADTLIAGAGEEAKPADDPIPVCDKPSDSTEEQQSPEKSPAEATTEAEVLSTQEKVKAQGSPLKKLFTGAGLKKLSKKQKGKKEAEVKVPESGEQAAEQIQPSTEPAESQKPDSSPSSSEESGEHVVEETPQSEAADAGEAATSDSEKKKDGILPWASFKKLVTPKKHVKRSSESEDETSGDKPKSATLSSTESAVLDDKPEEMKPSDEVNEEPKEESQIESKTETKAEKAEQSTEEPKRKMDTSVSWEALICVGSAKKRARKTLDSDDEETKIDEEVQQSGEEQPKTAESPLTSSQEAERENVASSSEPEGELVSTWESFKRLVTHRKKPKAEEKSDEASAPEQAMSDSEMPKEESSFSLRKLIPRRKKKSAKQGQVSSDIGSAEEDSDTPAVVPLSEYDNEQPEKAVADEVKIDETKTDVAPVTPAKISAEDRSPSWISATVEDIEDEARGKQLSDIPEEGDTAATPKSTDNTIAEDIVDFTSEAVTALEPVEETEMVSAMSRVTASPVTSGETTPVPGDVLQKDEIILQEAVETVSVTSSAMAVTVTEELKKMIPASSCILPVQSAVEDENVVLVVCEKSEATALSTGLKTSEIKGVEEESPLKASVESVTAVGKAGSMEITVKEQTLKPEEAGVTQDTVFEVRVNEVQTEYKEETQVSVENAVEMTAQAEAMKETSKTETVDEFQQATAVKVAVVSAIQQEAEILEEPVLSVKTLKVEAEGPVEPTVEESVCAHTVQVTETTVSEGEKVDKLKDVKDSVTSVVVASAEAVAMAPLEERTTVLADEPVTGPAMFKEDNTPVAASGEESAVTEEIIFVSPDSKTEGELKDESTKKDVPALVTTSDLKIQDTVKEMVSANVLVEGHVEGASSNISAVVEERCEKVEEEVKLSHTMHVKEEQEVIQEQSTVIVQEVIQNVVENLGDLNIKQLPGETPVGVKNGTTVAEETTKTEEVPSAFEKTEEKITTAISAEADKLVTDVPAAQIAVPDEKASEDVPVHEEKYAVDSSVQVEKPTADIKVQKEKPPTESITDKPLDGRVEIKAQEEEVPTVSTDARQEGTDVIMQEIKLGEVEKIVEDEKTVGKSTDLEDRKRGVDKELKDVETEIQKVSTDTPASEASTSKESYETREVAIVVSRMEEQVLEEQCQQVQDIKTKTTMEINAGMIHVLDASDEPVKDTEATMKEDRCENQEPLEDRPQMVLDGAQKDISTQDMKGQEGHGDALCQHADAEASEAKVAVEENAIKEEMDHISTETATVS
ncbi:A-kinase anchor protein 12b isoform X2 [Electrophorus electricus]|uniref:A-kinase anchor protein 12b isoform X2 n=1 Tax=Electrophorus electricus TaxID=8005 RepID=UPI0015D01663|nr:A-kinase anchor protein 12b isoform X2 [Electrophorus electricus]